MRTDFYKAKAEELLVNLENTRLSFKELVDSDQLQEPKNFEDETPSTTGLYSDKFKYIQDDFINLIYAFDREMPFYKKMTSEQMPFLKYGLLKHSYNENCEKLKSLIEKFIHYLSFYHD